MSITCLDDNRIIETDVGNREKFGHAASPFRTVSFGGAVALGLVEAPVTTLLPVP
jgi:hypothetical protein